VNRSTAASQVFLISLPVQAWLAAVDDFRNRLIREASLDRAVFEDRVLGAGQRWFTTPRVLVYANYP
jgi:hypothetical protein